MTQYGVSIDWGDGTPAGSDFIDGPPNANSVFPVSTFHTYAQTGTYRYSVVYTYITIDTTPPAMVEVAGTIRVVRNSPGGVTLKTSTRNSFGGAVGTFSTDLIVTSATVNWGDGTTTDGTVTPLGTGRYSVSGSHNYSDPGLFPVDVTALLTTPGTDGDETQYQTVIASTASVSGRPAPITAAALSTNQAYVGVPFSGPLAAFAQVPTQTAANPFTDDPSATINWGDDSAPTVIPASAISSGTFQPDAQHFYGRAGTFSATVSFSEGSSLRARVRQEVIVSLTSVGGVAANVEAGQAFSGVIGTFSGYGGMVPPASGGGVTINWGDGQTTSGTVTTTGDDVYQVSGTHTYASAGVYPVQLSSYFFLSDPTMNQQATIDSSLAVLAPTGSKPPQVVGAAGQVSPGIADEVATGISASFTGVVNDSAYQYSATVQFSNGAMATPNPLTFDPQGALDVSAPAPLFDRPGTYSAAVRVYRDGLLIGSVRVPVPVSLNSPTGVTITATAGQSFSDNLGTFQSALSSDPSQQYPVGVNVVWGDGTSSAGTLTLTSQTTDTSGDAVGIYAAAGSHAYAKPGRYQILVFQVFSPISGSTPVKVVYDTAVVRKVFSAKAITAGTSRP